MKGEGVGVVCALDRRALRAVLLAVLALAVVAAGCAQPYAAGDDRKTITVEGGAFVDVMPAGLDAMMKGKDFVLVNVHVPYQGEIAGTDLFIPYDQVAQNLEMLPRDRKARIVLYCLTGHMSAEAAQTLVKLGYTDVWNLHGGMAQWRLDGYPLADRGT